MPPVETPAPSPTDVEPKEELETISVRGVPQTVVLFEKKRGTKVKPLCRIKINPNSPNPFAEFAKAVGIENYNRMVAEAINEICDDAADDSREADGKVNLKTFAEKVPEQLTRGGSKTGVKELRKRLSQLSSDLAPLMELKFNNTPMTELQKLEFARVFAEWKEVNAKVVAKERTGHADGAKK